MSTTITPEERAEWREKHTAEPFYYGHRIVRLLDALEAAEAQTAELEDWGSRLVYAVTDGRMSKLYAVDVVEEQVNAILEEYVTLRGEEAEARAEKAEKANSQCIQTAEHMRGVAAQEQQRRMKAERERDVLAEALTPSTETKVAYMSEIKDNGRFVSWTAIKDIMAMIRKRAKQQAAQGER